LLVLLLGQPEATERADGIAAEPLRDAVLVEGVGAGHRPHRLVGAEVLQADGALLTRATTRHLLEAQDGLASGTDARTLAAAMSGGRQIIIVITEHSGGQINIEEVIWMDGRGRGDWHHRPGPRPRKDMDASISLTLPAGTHRLHRHRRILIDEHNDELAR